ncbi:MAG: hypothetical protein HYU69_06215 [Bacteroidetes bacterium]|nr:hypothetical protein [Bacteroidota bacterium]
MKQNESTSPKIQLKAYSKKEVAQFYEVSPKTLKTWLTPFENEIGQKMGRFYNPKQMKIIFDKLGIPEVIHFN